ncbi:MAG: sulfotransferase [Alphaproteobacteria bacterium]
MTLSVIGAGFGRTGTLSIKMALEQLGFGPCHHMHEVLEHPEQLPHWEALARGEAVDWNAVFDGYASSIDWPSAHYWRELAAFYPDAKVILSTRPPEKWLKSFSATIKPVLEMRGEIPDPHVSATMKMADGIITKKTFGNALDDDAAVLAAYRKRIEDVTSTLPRERLLVFDVAEGWIPLCAFLGKPAPDNEFPRSNSQAEFWAAVRGEKA